MQKHVLMRALQKFKYLTKIPKAQTNNSKNTGNRDTSGDGGGGCGGDSNYKTSIWTRSRR